MVGLDVNYVLISYLSGMNLIYRCAMVLSFLMVFGGALLGQSANISPSGEKMVGLSAVTQAQKSGGYVGMDGVSLSEEEFNNLPQESRVSSPNSNHLQIVLNGMGDSPEDFQVFHWEYGDDGIFNDSGMRIISIKGNSREVFASRINKLSGAKGIQSLELRDLGGQLAVTVSGIPVSQVFELIKSTVED